MSLCNSGGAQDGQFGLWCVHSWCSWAAAACRPRGTHACNSRASPVTAARESSCDGGRCEYTEPRWACHIPSDALDDYAREDAVRVSLGRWPEREVRHWGIQQCRGHDREDQQPLRACPVPHVAPWQGPCGRRRGRVRQGPLAGVRHTCRSGSTWQSAERISAALPGCRARTISGGSRAADPGRAGGDSGATSGVGASGTKGAGSAACSNASPGAAAGGGQGCAHARTDQPQPGAEQPADSAFLLRCHQSVRRTGPLRLQLRAPAELVPWEFGTTRIA
mmetsp:Transcript_57584/g.184900  ORF Transcript_57584/g.184900 Transcript_57584/m.184900 type:complete len:278 (-) Transcript_57584:86-919(-)